MVDYAELADVRAYGKFTGTDTANNAYLESLIPTVSRMMDAQLGTCFAPDTDETRYFTVDDLMFERPRDLFLGIEKLLSVTSIVNADGTSISTDDVILLPQGYERKHTVRLKSTSSSSWDYDEDNEIAITGRWGYSASIPDDVKQICVEWVLHIFNARGDQGSASRSTIVTQDGMMISPNSAPPRVRDFLKRSKYRRRL